MSMTGRVMLRMSVCRCWVSSPLFAMISLISAPFGLKVAEMESARAETTKSDARS
jgi:hypothetical protein